MSILNEYGRNNLGFYNSGTYTPATINITGITNANPASITTAIAHSFVIGQEVQFFIPPQWGITQLNNQSGYVLSIPTSTSFTVDIDTSTYNVFITPSPATYVVIDKPQVAGIGDANFGQSSPGAVPPNPNTVPGAYQNQPP
ncbi:hypothetical protein UFOVP80_23 [uncultured Caudovirales phage]|jgi:hypothetical protein|uniref:Uncharacterized protein n=1 Tax=uncultured Caudovirales phage TaxID=2100421 RepID=A0A6J5KVT5_9CAUD|nr:hypothetical protein UFOVP80_23 [uncultured Caudovirales phage]